MKRLFLTLSSSSFDYFQHQQQRGKKCDDYWKGKKRSSTLLFYMKFIFLPAELLIATEWRYIHFDTVLRCADDNMLWAFRFRSASKHFFSLFVIKCNQMTYIGVDNFFSYSGVLWLCLGFEHTHYMPTPSWSTSNSALIVRSLCLYFCFCFCICHCFCLFYCL